MNGWNKCNECGKYIALDDFTGSPPKAVNRLVNPDAYGYEELWDTYHVDCRELLTERAGRDQKEN